MANCVKTIPKSRYKPFFTYHPNACGSTPNMCNTDMCGTPGFGFGIGTDGLKRVDTSQRAASIALLILMTRGASTSAPCGANPRIANGYWGDSFRSDNLKSGTGIYDVPIAATTAQALNLIKAYATRDLQKLVTYGEAEAVSVTATYAGGGKISLVIQLTIDGSNTTLPLTASGNGTQWTVG